MKFKKKKVVTKFDATAVMTIKTHGETCFPTNIGLKTENQISEKVI